LRRCDLYRTFRPFFLIVGFLRIETTQTWQVRKRDKLSSCLAHDVKKNQTKSVPKISVS
jgi:hypothetical protein